MSVTKEVIVIAAVTATAVAAVYRNILRKTKRTGRENVELMFLDTNQLLEELVLNSDLSDEAVSVAREYLQKARTEMIMYVNKANLAYLYEANALQETARAMVMPSIAKVS